MSVGVTMSACQLVLGYYGWGVEGVRGLSVRGGAA